jgi:thiamine-monophosphate kinase
MSRRAACVPTRPDGRSAVPVGEFDLIARYFQPLDRPGGRPRADVVLGIGDDAAILRVPVGQELVAAIDSLVAGTHFLPGCDPASIGHRALAVNLSDLAAMGATPAWALLALTLPAADEVFLEAFARGLRELAAAHDVAIVGGDTTAGPLAVTVQALGFAPPGAALRRDGAAAGDLLFVSGTPGDAAAGLLLERAGAGGMILPPALADAGAVLRRRFLFPMPRVALGLALRGLASACIDVSDGLAGDAGKLAAASGCGARIEAQSLPLSPALVAAVGRDRAVELALGGGDDYELCFSVPPGRLAELSAAVADAGCPVRCIGVLTPEPGLRVLQDGKLLPPAAAGYDHFTNPG